MTRNVDVAIIGAGTAGLSAMAQVRRKTKNFVIIDGGTLGTTCARIGCMPSKALINIADDFHRRSIFEREGIEGGDQLSVDLEEAMEHVRHLRDVLTDRVISHTTDNLDDEFIPEYAEFLAPDRLQVGEEQIQAKRIVIAVGSRPIVPKAWQAFGDRIVTTDDFFELETLPPSMVVVGLGVIGLELGQAMARLGVEVTGIDALDTIARIDDPAVRDMAIELIGKSFSLHLGQPAEIAEENEKLRVRFGEQSVLADKVLASLGRRSNIDRLGLDKLDVKLRDDGAPRYNPHSMQVHGLPIFIAGDANDRRQILHEAGNEGRIAGYNAVRDQSTMFHRTVPLNITFSDPQICQVGKRLGDLEEAETAVGEFKYGPLGRGLVMGQNKGVLRLYADKSDGRLLGATMCAPRGENIAHLIAWSMEQRLTVFDMLRMPFYHPVFEEALQGALRSTMAQLEAKLSTPPEIRPLPPKE
ncbi:MAG: dihydrolipoyl dehydrogenase [Pseudomonadota bacterium]|nr:dihydrolipoyl dehydrogenase [Pseudomonadota bacterium]